MYTNLPKLKFREMSDEQLAKYIADSDQWDLDALAELVDRAGMREAFAAADGETFEAVAYAAAEKLGYVI